MTNEKMVELIINLDTTILALVPYVQGYVQGRALMIKITTHLSIPPFIEIVPQPFYIKYNHHTMVIVEIDKQLRKVKIEDLKRLRLRTIKQVQLPPSYRIEFFL